MEIKLSDDVIAKCIIPVKNAKYGKNMFYLKVLIDEFPDYLELLYENKIK